MAKENAAGVVVDVEGEEGDGAVGDGGDGQRDWQISARSIPKVAFGQGLWILFITHWYKEKNMSFKSLTIKVAHVLAVPIL